MKKFFAPLLFLGAIFLLGCGGGTKYKKSPLDEIIRDLPDDEVFSIILYDMNVEGNFFEKYYHQYKIIRGDDADDIREVTTEFKEVGKEEFNRYVNDMGMEIAARDSTGNLTKAVAPPGYNNYVGNPRYGYWNNSGGSSFWAFYGQYAFMSSLFRMGSYPVQRGYYDDWGRNYRGTGRTYYGPSSGGGSYYGTNSTYNRSSNPNSNWSRNTSNFKRRVASRTSRSSSTRSSSSSYRSRGSSFGK